jgi:hypothetical protein
MSSLGKPRRLLSLAMAAALAAGAGTAVVASGSGSGTKITIGDTPGDKITVYGSRLDDTIYYGGFTENITVAANRDVTSLRHDCDVDAASPHTAFCSRNGEDQAYSKLDTQLARGADHMEFNESFDSPGFRILGGGGKGGDTLAGTETKDEFSGGRGDDGILGYEGDDDLDGGRGFDACDGGSGANEIRRCESLR